MATITREIASMDGGVVVVQLDYDSATLRASAVRVINNGATAAYVQAQRTSDGMVVGQRFAPGTAFISIPTTGAGRFDLTDPGDGKLSGISVSIVYPYP